MIETGAYDAVVVGAGPNGLAAAVELARNGRRVAVLEAGDRVGGGTRSDEVTLPGFVHDLGSAIHPLGYASPFFATLPLEEHGLEWIHPPAPLAHPLHDGTAAALDRPPEPTGGARGRPRAHERGYRRHAGPRHRGLPRPDESPGRGRPAHTGVACRISPGAAPPARPRVRRCAVSGLRQGVR